jgi:hypothetical protein
MMLLLVKRLSTLAAASLLALVLFNGFLSLPPFRLGGSPMQYDPILGFWHKPDYRGRAQKTCYDQRYSFDDAGRRPGAVSSGKPQILILGDSQMEAAMVPDGAVLHNLLAAELGGRVDVLDYGLANSDPSLHYIMLRRMIDLGRTRQVLQFVNLDNDVYEADPSYRRPGDRPRAGLFFRTLDDFDELPAPAYDLGLRLRDLMGDLEIYPFLSEVLYTLRSEARAVRGFLGGDAPAAVDPAAPTAKAKAPSEAAWTQLIGALYQSRNLLRQRGIDYLVLVWSEDDALRQELVARLDRLGIEHFDVRAGLLAEGGDPSSLTFACDNHLTPASHVLLARALTASGAVTAAAVAGARLPGRLATTADPTRAR